MMRKDNSQQGKSRKLWERLRNQTAPWTGMDANDLSLARWECELQLTTEQSTRECAVSDTKVLQQKIINEHMSERVHTTY